MMTSYPITVTLAAAFVLVGCSTPTRSPHHLAANFINRENIVLTTNKVYPAKNPTRIALFNPIHPPMTPYKIIGEATVSKYNLIGRPRKEEIVQEMMKKLAASIGGDGLINIKNNPDAVKASVIQYQRILL